LATIPLRLTASNFIFQLNTCSYSPSVASSLTRGWVCSLKLLLTLTSAVILRSHDHILLPQIRNSPQPGGPGPRIYIPRDRVARLYPRALGSVFVSSYNSQGYGGGIRPTVSRLVCLGIKHPSALKTRSLLLSEGCKLSLTRGRIGHWPESQSAVVSLLSVCTIYILHVIKRMYVCINVRIYDIYKASVSPGSVQQIMPYY
jgi:hypothetical protein